MLSIADGNRTLNIYYKGATSRSSTLFINKITEIELILCV